MTDISKPAHSERVTRALALVAVQAECDMNAAYAMMLSTAQATDETIEQIADEVVSGNVSFA